MASCRRCVVKGSVQGVFYRHSTREKANELGLTGWVRNLLDGNVECLICGDEKALETMCEWLKIGPPSARVSAVEIAEAPLEEHPGFRIMRE